MNVTRVFEGQDVTIDGRDVDVSALTYDSRRMKSNTLFAAIAGTTSDGHAFIKEAVEQGAIAVLVERDVDTHGATKILAKDSRRALAKAAHVFYGAPTDRLTMVGVTGTNGKTTTAFLIAAVLDAAKKPCGVVGTLGVRFGDTSIDTGMTTPESLELQSAFATMRDQGAKAVSMEVSSHALAQGRVEGVAYDVAVFTNLTHDHLDFHGTFENYFAAKAELFRSHLKPNAKAVINIDDVYGAQLASELGDKVITTSAQGNDATLTAKAVQLALDGTQFTVGDLHIDSPLVGRFNVDNLLAAIGVGLALGIAKTAIAEALRIRGVVPGRLERVQANVASRAEAPVVFVDYAHTPDALLKALQTVRGLGGERLICVFGCGGDRDSKKREPMGEIVAKHADVGVVTNDNPRTEDPKEIAAAIERGLVAGGAVKNQTYFVELDRERAINWAIAKATTGDAVLIAGKGHEDYQIVGSEKKTFDDREVARLALRRAASTAALTARGDP
ncbi:MAG: UDP-N-acetylmuramoyl-L-alanyl-D-glutamate--2,6-diaminopimelate ligase [Clostridia bacterium]|nr:UDP-N-acetylmuramoyl-L-alanyl-D-glutamate--2,6-diaminopimelate ligase [Deltaproteobacteria bacterium]